LRIDVVGTHDSLRDPGNNGGFSSATALIAFLEPVPAFGWVGASRLGGIEHYTRVLFRNAIHAGAGGEIVGILRAAMQHDYQRQRLSAIAAGDV
jgi:hypothetical protein